MTAPGERSILEVIQPVSGAPYLDILEDRFGMPRELFAGYAFFHPNKDGLWIVNRDLRAPERPEPHVLGMPFFRTDMRFPRPSTNAVLKFGGAAVKNTVDLEEGEIGDALFRRELELESSRARSIESNGYVIVRFRGRALCLGYFRPDDGETGTLKAMVPKLWTEKLGLTPPAC